MRYDTAKAKKVKKSLINYHTLHLITDSQINTRKCTLQFTTIYSDEKPPLDIFYVCINFVTF